MKQRACRTCGSVMKKETSEEGIKFFCRKCEAYTEYEEIEMEAWCPDCGEKISNVYQCCSLSFFCSRCGEQKSPSKLVWKK